MLFNHNNQLEELPRDLPDLNQLLEFEKQSRKNGSDIEFNSLIGDWRFATVWKNFKNKENIAASFFLRVFSAKLCLENDSKNEDSINYKISNSIQFGLLSLKFVGFANLQEDQTLLTFYFESIELYMGSRPIFIRKIPIITDIKKRPFFALIALGTKNKWLSARGRGGGLALWIKE